MQVVVFFFFQAEDGIRDIGVTGVQTCALPIWIEGLGVADVRRYAVLEEVSQAGTASQRLVGLARGPELGGRFGLRPVFAAGERQQETAKPELVLKVDSVLVPLAIGAAGIRPDDRLPVDRGEDVDRRCHAEA